MFSQTAITKVVFALALAMVVAWAGHSHAPLQPSGQPVWSNEIAHGHDHLEVFAYPACVDHAHASLAADHLHETPLLTALLELFAQPERHLPTASPLHTIPSGPLFLIERPSRPGNVS